MGDNGTRLNDICYMPMKPDVNECTIQSVLGWWQGREDYLLKSVVGTTNGYNYTYLDHAIYCSKYGHEHFDFLNPNFMFYLSFIAEIH
jgi:hypothetical protein